MRFLAVFRKFLLESLREWGILLLALAFAPFFVILFHFAFSIQPAAYTLAVVNEDREAGSGGASTGRGQELLAAMKAFNFGDASLRIKVEELGDRTAAVDKLKKTGVDLVLVIPGGFSGLIARGGKPTLVFLGDMASAKYAILLAFVYSAAEGYVGAVTGRESLLGISETSIRPDAKMKAFDAMIPSLVILSLMTVLFTAAALFVREAEKGTIKRLQLSRLSPLEYLGAAALSQLLVSVACVFLTLVTAMAFGYRLESSLAGLLFVGALAGFSVIAFGLVTAGLCSSVKDVMIIGNFPYFFMLLFSGVMPIPSPVLFTLAGRQIGMNGLFPMSFGVKALEGMMNYGRPLGDLGFEIAAMALMSAAWFGLGIALFYRKHLRS